MTERRPPISHAVRVIITARPAHGRLQRSETAVRADGERGDELRYGLEVYPGPSTVAPVKPGEGAEVGTFAVAAHREVRV